jgi:hypothetical protein
MRMITRTFRMSPEYDKILSDESERHGLTVSALLNQIIRQYVLVTRFTERTPSITMSYGTFSPLIEHIDDEYLAEVAEKTGAIIPEEAILQRGQRLTFDNLKCYIREVYGTYGNWFNASENLVSGKERIHLSHQLNRKWSIYLGNYMNSMFNTILNINPKIETRDNSVTIYVPKQSPVSSRMLQK